MDDQQKYNEQTILCKLEYISAIFVFVIFISVVSYLTYIYEQDHRNESKFKIKGFSTMLTSQFNGPTGEHKILKKYAKQYLEYPASYKHIETIYIRNDRHHEVFVRTLFSGQDSYKTERIFCIKAIYSFDGKELKPPVPC